jgi:SAM-dependent methyltransferase
MEIMYIEADKLPLHTSLAPYYDGMFGSKYRPEVEVLEWIFTNYGNKNIQDVLDLMCGTGAHAILLSKSGFNVVGIDASEHMMNIAINKRYDPTNPKFLHMDIRDIDYSNEFDAVICLFNCMQYFFKDEDLNDVIVNIYKALREGGLFVTDLRNGHGFITRNSANIPFTKHIGVNGIDIEMRVMDLEFNEVTSIATYHTKYIINDEERTYEMDERHSNRFFERDEFENALRDNGFIVLDVLGSTTEVGVPLTDESNSMMFIARK